MKNIILTLTVLMFAYVAYKGYPYLVYKYKMYTASSKGINTKAPNAKASTIDGKEWSVKNNLGKNIIVVFWSSYCPPCIAEIPHIRELYEKHKDDDNLEIVSYSLDLSQDVDTLKPYIKEKNIPYPVLVEKYPQNSKDNFAKKFEVFGAPSIWFIDKKGTILASNRRSIKEVIPFIK
jgi:thiol-disulfide isomerase/thioredoxin